MRGHIKRQLNGKYRCEDVVPHFKLPLKRGAGQRLFCLHVRHSQCKNTGIAVPCGIFYFKAQGRAFFRMRACACMCATVSAQINTQDNLNQTFQHNLNPTIRTIRMWTCACICATVRAKLATMRVATNPWNICRVRPCMRKCQKRPAADEKRPGDNERCCKALLFCFGVPCGCTAPRDALETISTPCVCVCV